VTGVQTCALPISRDGACSLRDELKLRALGVGSPLKHAAAIRAPVLLVHGDLDQNVAVLESERMNEALQAAGTPVEFLRFKGLDHQLEDSAARKQMLTKIGQLLEKTIGR